MLADPNISGPDVGVSIGMRSEFIPASAMVVGYGAAARGGLPSSIVGYGFSTFRFDQDAFEAIYSSWRVPPNVSGGLSYAIYWAMDTGTSDKVYIRLGFAFVADGEVSDEGDEELDDIIVTVPDTAKTIVRSEGTISADIAAGDVVGVLITRLAQNAQDTATGDWHFIGIEFVW